MDLPSCPRRTHPDDAIFSTWRAGDGWPLRRMDLPASTPRRGALLFASGRGDFIEKNLEAALHWQARGWDVTSFDWRGQGGSAGEIVRGHLTSFDPLVADGAGFIAAWQREVAGPHVAVAHSMGGHLLLRVLAERRAKLAAAVLVAPMLRVRTRPLPGWAASLAARLMVKAGAGAYPLPVATPETRQRNLTGCRRRFADELWWKTQRPEFDLGPPTWGWLDAAFRSQARLTPTLLAGVALPILLIGSDRDRLVQAAAIRRAAALLPRSELLMLPDAAHELLRELDPVRDVVLGRIDGFLGQAMAA